MRAHDFFEKWVEQCRFVISFTSRQKNSAVYAFSLLALAWIFRAVRKSINQTHFIFVMWQCLIILAIGVKNANISSFKACVTFCVYTLAKNLVYVHFLFANLNKNRDRKCTLFRSHFTTEKKFRIH